MQASRPNKKHSTNLKLHFRYKWMKRRLNQREDLGSQTLDRLTRSNTFIYDQDKSENYAKQQPTGVVTTQ
jgi:hypothetical protein